MPTNGRYIGEMSEAVSAELRAELARRKIPVRTMASLTGIPLSTLQRTLNAQRAVDVEDLNEFCTFLDIETSELIARATLVARAAQKNIEQNNRRNQVRAVGGIR